MSRARSLITPTLPIVFALSEEEAAASVGISHTKFRELVAARRMPSPRRLDGRKLYDVDELREAFKSLPHEAGADEVDTWGDVG